MQERRATSSTLSKMPLSLPQWLALFTATALLSLIGWLDYLIGWEYSLFVFYALPIGFVIWKIDSALISRFLAQFLDHPLGELFREVKP